MKSISPSDNPETPSVSIYIPKTSFTAFRLMYAPANEISELAKCVFLGKIPDLWWAGEKAGIFGQIALKLKTQVRNTIGSTADLFSDILRGELNPNRKDYWTDEMKLQARYNKSSEMALRSIYWHCHDQDDDSESPSEDEMNEESYQDPEYIVRSINQPDTGETLSIAKHDATRFKGETNRALLRPLPLQTETNSRNSGYLTDWQSSSKSKENRASDEYMSQASSQNPKLGTVLTHKTSPFSITSFELISYGDTEKKVMFNTDGDSQRHSRIRFASPNPESASIGEAMQIKTRNRHLKALGRIHHLASRSKRKAIKTSYKFRSKVTVNFLKNYGVGDILRIDRMLVVINKEGLADTSLASSATRTENRLNEYFVVLRKGADLDNPLEVQLFKPEQYGDFSGKPEHKIILQRGDDIVVYSNVEKSFKVTETREEYLRVFVFIPHFTKLCFMWMFLVQTILSKTYSPIASVHIEDTDISLNIPVSANLLPEGSSTHKKELELALLSEGYRVKYDSVIDYLLRSIKESLGGMQFNHRDIEKWIAKSDDMWFCFKFFDRLEWILNDTDIFFIQYHIQRTDSQLEVRQRRRTPLRVTRDNKVYTRPYPIEGFLSRITNTSGETYSNLRAFFKIQYFHTADNLLFFTKLLLSVPPSPGNVLLENNNRQVELNMPEIFVRSPFQTDEKGHIPWLDSADFDKFDREAVGEFIRRVQQITKASAVLDLCTVKKVVPLKCQEIPKHHLYFQSLFWHSSSVIISDEALLDSGFEIILSNGGKLKFLAPSRYIRDQWVERLTRLVEYWGTKKVEDMVRQVQVREENMKKFEVKEHIDSNATSELQGYFSLSSTPNDFLFDSSHTSMPTNLVKSGYIYNKLRKHSGFTQGFLVLCPGYLILFTLFKRSKATGKWKQTPFFERYMTLPLSMCYIYSGELTLQDLLDKRDSYVPGEDRISRFYADGWKSSEDDSERCFSVWFGKKRELRHSTKSDTDMGSGKKSNPGLLTMIRKLGLTGKKMVFLCRSRQERESWVHAISTEIDRLST